MVNVHLFDSTTGGPGWLTLLCCVSAGHVRLVVHKCKWAVRNLNSILKRKRERRAHIA